MIGKREKRTKLKFNILIYFLILKVLVGHGESISNLPFRFITFNSDTLYDGVNFKSKQLKIKYCDSSGTETEVNTGMFLFNFKQYNFIIDLRKDSVDFDQVKLRKNYPWIKLEILPNKLFFWKSRILIVYIEGKIASPLGYTSTNIILKNEMKTIRSPLI